MEIAISLDTYDDLFSDFDVRGYADRALSRDFLDELHVRLRRMLDKTGLEIVLLIPEGRRSLPDEARIVERLRRFYAEREAHYVKEDRNAALRGLAFIGIGLALSALANYIVERFRSMPLFNDFLLIPSWFFVWNGFDCLIKRGELRKKRRYYAELSASRTTFRPADTASDAMEGRA
jgi:hypothetical protein